MIRAIKTVVHKMPVPSPELWRAMELETEICLGLVSIPPEDIPLPKPDKEMQTQPDTPNARSRSASDVYGV